MITALIIDDEASVRIGLQKHINWKKLGVDEVTALDTAEKAIAFLSHNNPDLIITDIRLPKMDGISLTRFLREKENDFPYIIFISAYSELDYYKNAIKLDVEDYIEKPIQINKMENAVKKVIAKILSEDKRKQTEQTAQLIIDSHNEVLHTHAIQNLIKGIWNEEIMSQFNSYNPFISQNDSFIVILIKTPAYLSEHDQKDTFSKLENYFQSVRYISMIRNNQTIMYLLSFTQNEYLTRTHSVLSRLKSNFYAHENMNGPVFITLSECCTGYQNIPYIYTQAVCQLQKLFFTGYNAMVLPEASEEKIISSHQLAFEEFKYAVITKNQTLLLEIVQNMYSYMKEQVDTLPDIIKNIYFRLNLLLLKTDPEDEPDYLWVKFNTIETINECQDMLLDTINVYFTEDQDVIYENQYVNKVIKYIKNNFKDDNLSVKTIADSIGLTTQYMTGIFKSKTGITVGQYLKRCRLEYSEDLLLNSDYPLRDIASLSGYTDENYWSKVFRKQYNLTPSEFRKRFNANAYEK